MPDYYFPEVNTSGQFTDPKVITNIETLAKNALVTALAAKRGVEPTELGTEHLDTVVVPDVYSQSSNLEATLETGYPIPRAGLLIVDRSYSKSMIWQTYIPHTPSATTPQQEFRRTCYLGNWTDWTGVQTMAWEAQALTTENLDTITAPRVYSQSTNTGATLELNYPTKWAGILEVTANNSRNIVRQVYRPYSHSQVPVSETWTRSLYNSNWSAWERSDVGANSKDIKAIRDLAESAQTASTATLEETRRVATELESLGVTSTTTELARNYVMDPLFKGNGWTGVQQVTGRSSWVESNGTATVTINTGTTAGNLLFEAIPDVGKAAPTTANDRWSMSVVLGVPAGSPELTLRTGVGYGPGPAVSINFSQTQTIAPGTSKVFSVVNNAPTAGKETALITVRAGGTIPDGAKFTVSKPMLTKGPTVGEFFHGDMPVEGEVSYAWEGKRHGSASVKIRTTVSRPATLDFVRDPVTGDIHKGDEVLVTGYNASRILSDLVEVPKAVPRGDLEARPATATSVAASYTPGAISKDRTRIYTSFANPPRYSDDDGQTWTNLPLLPGGVSAESTLLLDDGEMLVTGYVGSVGRRRVWRSEGLASGSPTWVQVLEAPFAGIKFTQAWSQSAHGRLVLINEYGPKAGMAWPGVAGDESGNVPRGEAAVRTYLSMDYGRTFKVIFNLHDWVTSAGGRSNSDMQHLHGVSWDPYWDRIWITYGDGMGGKGSNGVIYSDDLGDTWKFAHHTPEGSASSFQCVGIQPMPRCVLMFGDTTDAVMRIDRTHGKRTGAYPVDVAHRSTAVGAPKHLCQGFYRGHREGDDAPLLAAFSTEGGVGQDFIVATLDGYTFTEVWRGATNTPAGWGVRTPVGPTIRGQFLAATNANGGTSGQWAMIRIPATGY